MKNSRLLYSLIMLAGVSISGVARADHGHHGGHFGLGLYFGAPYPYYASPYYYPYPYDPYYPRVIAVPAPSPPPVYIEQPPSLSAPQQATAPQADNYWYHCTSPDGYYPYIKECPGGWQRVVPTPPRQ